MNIIAVLLILITKSSQTAWQPLCITLFCPMAQCKRGGTTCHAGLGNWSRGVISSAGTRGRHEHLVWLGRWGGRRAAPVGPTSSSSSHGAMQGKRCWALLGSAGQAHALPGAGDGREQGHHLPRSPSTGSLPSCLCRGLTVTGLSFSPLSEAFAEPFAKH